MRNLAPIGVSTYSRINHLKQTIEALQKNTLAKESDLYIFSDAPKPGDEEKIAKVRNYICTIDGFKTVNIIERKTNSRVKNNRGGIKQLLDEYGRMIFMEDDIVTASGFLQFMNDSLDFYNGYKNILSVSGHTPNLSYFNNSSCDVYLSKRFHGWGVGFWNNTFSLIKDISTWSKIKQDHQTMQNLKNMGSDMLPMIKDESDRKLDALDIKACYLCAKFGYANVLPTKTLVKNIGMDGNGVHCSYIDPYSNDSLSDKIIFNMIKDIKVDNEALREYEKFFSKRLLPTPCVRIDQNSIINKAVESLNNGNNTEALNLLDQAATFGPDILPSLAYGKAVAFARLGRFEEAIGQLNNLLAGMPHHKKAHVLLNEIVSAVVSNLITQSKNYLDANRIDEAFTLLNKAKSFKHPKEGLDYCRAVCFLKLNQPDSAREALREELRYFPNHEEARGLLDQILSSHPQITSANIDNSEFEELLEIIRPYTMVSEKRLFSLFSLAKRVCSEDIPGNFVECGVAAGGSSALLAAVIKQYSKRPRWLYSFDSFEGMPPPCEQDRDFSGTAADASGWGEGTCSASEGSVMEICKGLNVIDNVIPVKGYFEDTLPEMKDKVVVIALLHMNGDWYESTKTILHNLYDYVGNDGFIQVDDYGYWKGCRKAVDEFESSRKIHFDINRIDESGVWFRKPKVGLDFRQKPDVDNDVPKHHFIHSPLTGSSNVILENEINPDFLIDIYKPFGIDVRKYFEGLHSIQLYKCHDTGYRFYFPFNLEGDGKFYESLQKISWYYMNWKWEHEIASTLITPNDKVLEIGCARGGFIEKLHQKGIDCVGLELNRSAVEFARRKGLNVVEQSIQDHAQRYPEEYDVICSFQVLEHIGAVKDFIRAQIDVLKPGGKVIVSVPNNDAFMFKCDDIQALNRPPHHVGLWNTTSLISISRIFNLKLDGIEFEPLQPYHIEHSKFLVNKKLVQQYGDKGKSMIQDNESVISAVSKLILREVPGHTILAHYTKIDS